MSLLNRSQVKAYALAVSKCNRAGKFTRVSKQFLDAVEREVHEKLTALGSSSDQVTNSELDAPAPDNLLNKKSAFELAKQQMNMIAVRVVRGKVRSHPSIGCTLK